MKKRNTYILQNYRFRGEGEQWLFRLHPKMKEKFNSVYEGIMNKWHDWKSQHHLRIERLVYNSKHLVVAASIFVFLFAFFFAFFFQFRLFHTDAVSARYMLSALVQSQGAIVAIVITLTLIAVQLTASAYSPRVVDIFKNNQGMRFLLLLYGTSIFYGLIVLRLIEGNKGELVSQSVICSLGPLLMSLERCIYLALLLGIFAFVALVPYIDYIIDLLKPENIIKQLTSTITKDVFLKPLLFSMKSDYAKNLKDGPVDNLVKIEFNKNNEQPLSDKAKVSTIDEKHWEIVDGEERYKIENTEIMLNIYHNSKKDPIQPIIDIIRGSIRKYDFETTRVGLSAVTDQVISVIDSNCGEDISNSFFFTHLQGVGKLAVSVTDEESTVEVIENLKKFSEYTVGKQLEDATKKAITSLGTVGIATARKGTELEDAAKKVIEALGTVGKKAAEHNLEKATEEVATSLGAVGIATARKGTELEDAVKEAGDALGDMGKVAAENKLEIATKQVTSSLGDVGKAAAENELKIATEKVASSLGDVGKAAVENKLEIATKQVASSLGDVGKAAAENELKIVTKQVALSLKNIGMDSIKNNFEKAIKQVAKSLGGVGEAAAENKLENATKEVATSLGIVGEAAGKKGKELENVVLQAIVSLESIGKTAVAKGIKFEETIEEVLTSLQKIGYIAALNDREEVGKQIGESLGSIGVEAVVKKGRELKSVINIVTAYLFDVGINYIQKKGIISTVVSSFEEVGKAAAEGGKELTEQTLQVINILGTFGKKIAEQEHVLEINVLENNALKVLKALKTVAEKGKENEEIIKKTKSVLQDLHNQTKLPKFKKDVASFLNSLPPLS